MSRITRLITLGILILCAVVSSTAQGRRITTLEQALPRASEDPFAIGSMIRNPGTLRARSLEELITQTAGKVSEGSVKKYLSFAHYWEVSATSRTGKAFEAILTWNANLKSISQGSGEKFLATAAEGVPSATADIVKIDEANRVVARYQCKLGFQAAIEAIRDPKYAGQYIVVPTDTLEDIKKELLKQKHKALRRGRPLHPKWRNVEAAIKEGRLCEGLYPGQKLTRAEAEQITKNVTEKEFNTTRKLAGSTTKKLAGRAIIVLGYAVIAYQTYVDIQQYRTGGFGGTVLAVKLTLRGTEAAALTLTYSSTAVTFVAGLAGAPEPFVTKIAAVVLITVMAADIALNYYVDWRAERTRELLERIDQHEQFYSVKRQLMTELEAVVAPGALPPGPSPA